MTSPTELEAAAADEPLPPREPGLGAPTIRGFTWTVASAIGGKFIAVIAQVVLAWILDREAFGFVGLAYTVSAWAGLVQQTGVKDVLVQRHATFEREANAGFWLNLALGGVSSCAMAAAIPLAVWFYHEPRITGLIWVLALQNLVASAGIVPEARLSLDLRFKFLSIVTFMSTGLALVLTIVMAWEGFGAYSFVLPPFAASVVRQGCCWWASGFRPKWKLERKHWGYLFGGSWMTIAAMFCFTIVAQGDNMTLGRLYGKDVVGTYYWAFNLSIQAFQLVILNAATVLFPTLSRLAGDSGRQLSAFLRSAKVIALVAMPATALQAVAADAGIRLLFDPKWYPAIPMVELLSVGMILQVVGFPSISLMKAQGRYKTLLALACAWAALFLSMVITAALSFSGMEAALAVSAAVALSSCLTGPPALHLAIKKAGGNWGEVLAVFGGPGLAVTVAGGVTWILDRLLAGSLAVDRVHSGVRLVVDAVVFSIIYGSMARVFCAQQYQELKSRLAAMVSSRRHSANQT